ncbi:MAG: chorismate mutase [candidate division Zixibacteria bacterium]|nr:chorismate mutase [candidate division Zixibacteria bacterium]
MAKKDLKDFREEINSIDIELLFLFNRRANLVIDLARIKKNQGKKLFDPERERDIFVSLTEKNPGPLTPDAVVRLFERIIDESRRLERTQVYNKKEK